MTKMEPVIQPREEQTWYLEGEARGEARVAVSKAG